MHKFAVPAFFALSLTGLSLAESSRPGDRGVNTLLILDRESVDAADQVTFELNSAKKHPENPVLLPGVPTQWDGLQVTWPGTVLRDPDDHMFRCWYSGRDAIQEHHSYNWAPGYAESKDGIHWEKPILGQYGHYGAPTNRFAVDWNPYLQNTTTIILSTVFRNPVTSDPQRRFLSLWGEKNPARSEKYGKGLGKGLASSPDGKRWRWEKKAYEAQGPERAAFQDVCQLIYQPGETDPRFTVLGYSQIMRPRSWDGRVVRQIGLVHGPDFGNLRDADDPIILAPQQGIDEELHFASVRKVGDAFLMLFESDRFSLTPLHGDLRLAISSDGRHFRRVHPRSPLVATGGKGMWDANMLVTTTSAMQEVGDEVWIYYFGVPNVYVNWPNEYSKNGLRGSLYYPSCLGLATLPRDRFGCAVGKGSVTTHPIEVGQHKLWLNVEGSEVTVDAIDGSGRTVARGRLSVERDQTVYRGVEWAGAAPVGRVRLQISLGGDTRLYSLRY